MAPCYICIEEVSDKGEDTTRSPCVCRADVHYSCMQTWLQTSNTTVCPNCKRELQHMFGVEHTEEDLLDYSVDLNSDIACFRRFLDLTRVLLAVVCLYMFLIIALACTEYVPAIDVLRLTLLMLGPVGLLWTVFVLYLAVVEIKKLLSACFSPQAPMVVPHNPAQPVFEV